MSPSSFNNAQTLSSCGFERIVFVDTCSSVSSVFFGDQYTVASVESLGRKEMSQFHCKLMNAVGEFSWERVAFIFLAGPGSYTGMRTSEVSWDVLESFGVTCYRVRAFELPRLLGHEEYQFIGKAFKREAFVYNYGPEGEQEALVSEGALHKSLVRVPRFVVDESYGDYGISVQSLIASNWSRLIAKVLVDRPRRDVFYYRSDDQEFSKGK